MKRSEATLRECVQRMAGAGRAAIAVRRPGRAVAVLVDPEGVAYEVGTPVVIGRDPDVAEVSVAHDTVSRRHAELRQEEALWRLRDLGSTNGTFVEGRRVVDEIELRDRQLVSFGSVALVFLSEERARRVTSSFGLVVRPRDQCVELAGARSPLEGAALDFALLLARRWRRDDVLPEALRGYVRTREIAQALGSTSPRVLAASLRRALSTLGADAALELNERLGYRLRAQVVAGGEDDDGP